MKVLQAHVRPYRLRLRQPLRTSQGAFIHRSGFVLCLNDASGRRGSGDAAPWPGFGSSPAEVEAGLAAACAQMSGLELRDVAALSTWLAGQSWPVEVRHAVELACLDLLAQEAGVPVAQLLEPTARAQVAVHTLVPDAVSAKEAVRLGAKTIKVKVGAHLLEEDILRIGAIRVAVGDSIAIRLDANGAWPVEVALRAARFLSAFVPEWLEQPVAAHDIDGLRAVRKLGAMPIAADEAAQSLAGLEAVLAAEAADVVVLKPMFTGGLLAARDLQRRAQAAGVRTMVTHALESAVGRLGAAHLAAGLGGDLACGLNDPLSEDVADGPLCHAGFCTVPTLPGLGVAWRGEALC